MPSYMIGDVQGCEAPLSQLLELIDFSPSRDTLYFLGDLINRGPRNLATLNKLVGYGSSAVCLLGNHDLHFLGIERGLRTQKKGDTLDDLLNASNKHELVEWLRTRPLVVYEKNCLMVHAGVYPSWSLADTRSYAKELERALQGPDWEEFLRSLFGNTPAQWSDALIGEERSRAIVNALTRMRFCSEKGEMEFTTKGAAQNAPEGYYPWFAVPGRKTIDVTIAFGHWSALNPVQSSGTNELLEHYNVISLDTGCVWGGCLTAVELYTNSIDSKPPKLKFKPIQIKCETSDSTITRQA